eukprot:4473680-Ditylum_brightwellii.AAC.1
MKIYWNTLKTQHWENIWSITSSLARSHWKELIGTHCIKQRKKVFNKLKWATKRAAEQLSTSTEVQDRGTWPDASCPRNCSKEMETTDH